jgi:cyclic pyranopterin phosphate synthase
MPSENMKFMPDERLMSADEIVRIVSVFKELGIKKIRFTGGEPTLRKDLGKIIGGLSSLDLDMSITTNGLLLQDCLDDFKKFGLNNINISIDSIQREKFKSITKRDSLDAVLLNIHRAKLLEFNLKMNVVVIRGTNDDEIIDLLEWSAANQLPIRFIEYMPFFGNDWDYKRVFNQQEILDVIAEKYGIRKIESPKESTSLNYTVSEIGGQFGIIPTVTNAFCNGCNRIRLTADGKIKNCLFSGDENDLLGPLRADKDMSVIIRENIERKKFSAAGRIDFSHEKAKLDYSNNRSMVSIGG